MAYWDSKEGRTVHFPDEPCPEYPGWVKEDCGCCNGIKWGGYSPEECDMCNGGGHTFRHIKSGVHAQWPGGPFV